jgi:hypothetical protein
MEGLADSSMRVTAIAVEPRGKWIDQVFLKSGRAEGCSGETREQKSGQAEDGNLGA